MTIKKQSVRVLTGFLLLLTFITGQLIVITHTHNRISYNTHQTKKNTDDGCKICAQNSHLQLFHQQDSNPFALAVTAVNCYKEYQQENCSAAISRLSNKGPPVS